MKKCKYWLLVCLLLAGCSQSPVPTDPGVTLPIFPDREDYTAHYDASLVIGGSVTTGLASQVKTPFPSGQSGKALRARTTQTRPFTL